MRVFVAIAISIVFASFASAEVFVNVYRCDGKTPLAAKDPNTPNVYSDIMVGTKLVLVVSSDRPQGKNYWAGGLQCTWDDWERGKLMGREWYDPNDLGGNYRGSCLPAAGIRPLVVFAECAGPDCSRVGFDLATHLNALAGDWFVIDYIAEKVGSCDVGLFDYALGLDVVSETLSFTHVPSRDFDGNGVVNFADFASLASRWPQPVDPNTDPACPYDLDADQLIGPSDLAMFADYWLERTDCAAPTAEQGTPAAGL